MATERFKDAAGLTVPKQIVTFPSGFQMRLPQRGTIGADLVLTRREGGVTHLFDLKTHNGRLATLDAARERAFLFRFRAQSIELIHVRQ